MEWAVSALIGMLFACGLYCLLRRSVVRLVIGVLFLSQGANLLVFLSGGLTLGQPPMVEKGAKVPVAPFADPLPQAMVLTALVIGLGLVAFLLTLVFRAHEAVGSDDINSFDSTEKSHTTAEKK
ncbi:MAG: cation:proton antiporter [Verrucomicrobia bacterium]|jgi:multicomponent Na+:H+ antiporter subunit C|nr:cation:proton antiporter [Verrucomicrobiota bacterium]